MKNTIDGNACDEQALQLVLQLHAKRTAPYALNNVNVRLGGCMHLLDCNVRRQRRWSTYRQCFALAP